LTSPNGLEAEARNGINSAVMRGNDDGGETNALGDIPDGMIAHLTRVCGGNVHDRQVVDVTCGWFEKAHPHSRAPDNDLKHAAMDAAS
jgi:hypothetical protein